MKARRWRPALLLAGNLALLALLLHGLGVGRPAVSARPPADEPGGAERDPARASARPVDEAGTASARPAASTAGAPPDAALARLESRVERAIAKAVEDARALTGGKVNAVNTVVAVSAGEVGGATLLARQAERALRPASSLKLVTAAAALVHLSAEGAFETRFETRAPLEGGAAAVSGSAGVLRGDLVARAGADPLYRADGGGAIEEWLDALASELRSSGIRAVEGALLLDEGPFADPAPGPGWPSADQHWAEYCALSGGFSAGAGCLTASVRAGPVGSPASVAVEPRGHGLLPRLSVTTGRPRTTLDIAVEARNGAVTVRGSLPADVERWSARFAHPDPVALFGAAVVEGLGQRGIPIRAGWRRERGCAGGRVVARRLSPISDALVPILRDSDNGVADQLFLATAVAVTGAGTREAGRTATARALEGLGVPADGLVQVDGSGLSRDNRLSARQLTSLIEAVLRRGGQGARLYRDALPVAGESGSLASRMREGPARGRVRAKTGWIAGTSALAGLVERGDAEPIVFAVLVDYPDAPGLNTRCWKPMQDAICEALVAWGEGDV